MSNNSYLLPAILSWAKRYVTAAYKPNAPLGVVLGGENDLLENQLLFVPVYATLMQAGNDISQRRRVSEFLANQTVNNEKRLLEITFIEGYPFEVRVLTPAISDIDFEDVQGLTAFQLATIQRSDGTKWTDKRIAEAERQIKQDLSFDGQEISFDVGRLGENCLELSSFRVDGEKPNFPALAAGTGARDSLLFHLAHSTSWKVRFMVSGIKSITKQAVRALSKDVNIDVLLRLISNLSASAKMSKKEMHEILEKVAHSRKNLDNPAPIAKGLKSIFGSPPAYADDAQARSYRLVSSRITASPHTPAILSMLAKALEKKDMYTSGFTSEDEYFELTEWLQDEIALLAAD